MGTGGLGSLVLSVAALRRPRKLIAVDISPFRLEKAKALGADTTINPRETDPVEAVNALTGGAGPDIIIEVTGVPEVVLQAIDMAGFGTRLVVAGVFHRAADGFNPLPIHFKEIDILGSRGPYAHYTSEGELVAINLLRRGLIDVDALFDVYPFEQIDRALQAAVEGTAGPKVGVTYGG
jgi:threonine dehydrogenase-like Zn-dependent dehydrogenase